MKLKHYFIATLVLLLLLIASSTTLFHFYRSSVNELIDLSHHHRTATQLGQYFQFTTNKLTELARSYVVSSDPKYHQEYLRTLSIYRGETTLNSADMHNIFNRFEENEGIDLSKDTTFIALLKSQNIAIEEMIYIEKAVASGYKLSLIEQQAFRLLKRHQTAEKQLNLKTVNAINLLYTKEYQQGKQIINGYLKSFTSHLEQRLARKRMVIEKRSDQYSFYLATSLTALAIFLIICAKLLTAHINVPLNNLSRFAQKITQGRYQRIPQIQTPVKEVKLLASSLNIMLDEIHSQVSDLNIEVKESARLRKQAELANKARGEFLANMSHEIRTPLNAIMGLSHLVKETNLTEEQQDYIDNTIQSATSLISIINDILDISKIDSGKLAIVEEPFTIESKLQHISNLTALSAENNHIDYFINIAADVPSQLTSDPLRLRQILLNLVSNAIKFTHQGSVNIEVTRIDDTVQFNIIDSGIGMDQEQVSRIFEPFEQADNSTTRRFGGSGLGLAISKRLAQLLKGDINITSQLGKGTQVKLVLPLLEADIDSPTMHSMDNSRQAIDLQVLMSKPTHVAAFSHLAKQQGYQVTPINYQDFMAFHVLNSQVSENQILCVDCDLLAEISAPALAELNSKVCRMVVIGSAKSFQKKMQNSTIKHLKNTPWPILPSGLNDIITHVNSNTHLHGKSKPGSWSDADFKGLKVLLAEDVKMNQLVAKRMLNKLNINVDIAEDGKQVLSQVEKNQYDLILMDLHMPIMDGYQATKAIRLAHKLESLPIIGLSADAQDSSKKTCREIGMNDYITKPFQPADLIAKISAIMH